MGSSKYLGSQAYQNRGVTPFFFSKKSAKKESAGWSPRRYVFLSPDVIFFGFSFSRVRRGNDRNPTLKSFHVNLLDGWTWSVLETASQVYRLTLEEIPRKYCSLCCTCFLGYNKLSQRAKSPKLGCCPPPPTRPNARGNKKRFASVEAGP